MVIKLKWVIMENVEFKKINANRYNVTKGVDYIDTVIKSILEKLSVVSVNIYNKSINNNIYETLLSRYVSGLFIKKHGDISKNIHHIIITIGINERVYNLTLGSFNMENSLNYVNGSTEV